MRASYLWLIPAVVIAVAGAVWLWILAQPRVCILIYPAPPGCATSIPNWLPYIGIVLLAALLIAAFVIVLARPSTRALLITLVAMLVVIAVFVTIMYLAFAGVFDIPQPLE